MVYDEHVVLFRQSAGCNCHHLEFHSARPAAGQGHCRALAADLEHAWRRAEDVFQVSAPCVKN